MSNKHYDQLQAVEKILESIGEDPRRDGLRDTPKRVVKSWGELYSGYKQNPAELMKTFEEKDYDEMVILRDIEFYSMCEHHMLPFFGTAHIAYIPNGKVVGISKLARLLECYSRRLQIQERLCRQITQAIDRHLKPQGSACVIEAKHFCMVCRGVQKQNSVMTTSSLSGEFEKIEVRQEFLSLIGK